MKRNRWLLAFISVFQLFPPSLRYGVANSRVTRGRNRRRLALWLAVVLYVGGSVSAFAQGSLTPPGPPAPTMKTLDQVEPRIPIDATHTPGSGNNTFVITAPGSYYLTGNITLSDKAKTAIAITTSGVTVDLNGFRLSNVAAITDTTGGAGVSIAGQSCVVKNGTITGFVDGVLGELTLSTDPLGVIISDVAVKACKDSIFLLGTGSLVRNCTVTSCFFGISVGSGNTVEHCTASNNLGHGISASTYSTVVGCTAQGNGNQGSSPGGIVVDSGSTVVNCTAGNNSSYGIQALGSCLVSNCTASKNLTGIEVGLQSTVLGCTVSQSQGGTNGIQCASNQKDIANISVLHCTVAGNGGHGIDMGTGCTIANCTAGGNFRGIVTDFGSTVRNCTARFNFNDGIKVSGGCHVVENTCDQNNQNANAAAAGIHTTSNSNRLESNSCTFNIGGGYGYHIEGSNNLILHNSARGNSTNYFILTNNRYGEIVDLTSNPNFGPVNGNVAGKTTVTTDPWANFAY